MLLERCSFDALNVSGCLSSRPRRGSDIREPTKVQVHVLTWPFPFLHSPVVGIVSLEKFPHRWVRCALDSVDLLGINAPPRGNDSLIPENCNLPSIRLETSEAKTAKSLIASLFPSFMSFIMTRQHPLDAIFFGFFYLDRGYFKIDCLDAAYSSSGLFGGIFIGANRSILL